MATEGVDYAGDRPDPAGLWAAGKRFVVRYGGPGGDWKHLTSAEVRALDAAGLAIVANAEGTADGLLGGFDVGADWARSADQHFRALGMPAGRPIYLSVDFGVTSGQWPAVRDALRGAASVIGIGRVGVYGSRRAVEWARRDGVARWFWQTYAWSAGVWQPGNHLEQYKNHVALAGGTVDLCRAKVADYGQWTLSGQPHQEEDMDSTERTWLQRTHQRLYAIEQLQDSADLLGEPDEELPLTAAVKQIKAKVDQLAASPPGTVVVTDEQLDRVLRPIIADVLRGGAGAAES